MWKTVKTQLTLIPRSRWIIYGCIAASILAYLVWLKIHKPDIKPGQVITAQPAKAVKNEPVEVVKPKQVLTYRDTARVVGKLGLPPAAPQERVQTAVEIPRTKYGATATTFLNLTTGASRTQIKANSSPLFAFRNDLAIGVGAGIGTEGNTAAGRIRYDVAQIKAVTISGEIEGNYAERRTRPVEGRAMLWLEWRK